MSRKMVPTVAELEGQTSCLDEGPTDRSRPDTNVRVLCKPLRIHERKERAEKPVLGQNLQGQLSSEGTERNRCQPRSQSGMVRNMRTGPEEGRAQRAGPESGGWDRPTASVPNNNAPAPGIMKFPEVPSQPSVTLKLMCILCCCL